LNLKIRFIALILLFQANILFSFSQEETTSLPIISVETTGQSDLSWENYLNYRNSVSISVMANLSSSNVVNNELIFAALFNRGDSISIFNTNTNEQANVKIPNAEIVANLYFHNYDSIFIFLDRSFVHNQWVNGQKIADFYMIDTLGEIKGLYSLDSVPFIYKGSQDTMIFIRKFRLEGLKIKNNIFYIPFSHYRPTLSDTSLVTLKIRLLCAFDLESKKIKMYNVKLPLKDIGTVYLREVADNGFDYIFVDDSTIVYSFDYSTDIYRLNLNTDSVELIKSFPDFPFNNVPNPTNDCHSTMVGQLNYSPLEKKYIRDLFVRNYENYEDFTLTQVLDENFNLIGYYIGNSLFSFLKFNAQDQFILLNKSDNYHGSVVKVNEVNELNINDLKNNYLQKKNTVPKKNITFDYSLLNQTQKIELYISHFQIPKNSKIVILSLDNCGYVLDYVFSTLLPKIEELNLHCIIYAESTDMLKQLMKSNNIQLDKNIHIDYSALYKDLIESDIQSNLILVNQNKKDDKIVFSTYKTLIKDLKNF